MSPSAEHPTPAAPRASKSFHSQLLSKKKMSHVLFLRFKKKSPLSVRVHICNSKSQERGRKILSLGQLRLYSWDPGPPGLWYGMAGKGACCQAWPPEFDPWDPHNGRRASVPTSCPQSCTCAPAHSPFAHTKNNAKKKRKSTLIGGSAQT